MIVEKAYAKLNLSLSVLGKLNSGFHELESIMVPVIDLYDELYFEVSENNEFDITGTEIPNNSMLKAAKLFQEKYHTKGAKIHLIKRIPLEAGLAGGSADSSATLRGLNRLFNLNIPLTKLEELAKELGSDNVFCLYNRAAICTGRGEKLEFVDSDFSFDVLLIKPQFGLLTKNVFKNLTIKEKKQDICNVLLALQTKNSHLLENSIYNDLLDSAIELEPRLINYINELSNQNYKCHMSGSGTTLYVILHKSMDSEPNISNFEYVYAGKHVIKNIVSD